jgi:hypothetical protein
VISTSKQQNHGSGIQVANVIGDVILMQGPDRWTVGLIAFVAAIACAGLFLPVQEPGKQPCSSFNAPPERVFQLGPSCRVDAP